MQYLYHKPTGFIEKIQFSSQKPRHCYSVTFLCASNKRGTPRKIFENYNFIWNVIFKISPEFLGLGPPIDPPPLYRVQGAEKVDFWPKKCPNGTPPLHKSPKSSHSTVSNASKSQDGANTQQLCWSCRSWGAQKKHICSVRQLVVLGLLKLWATTPLHPYSIKILNFLNIYIWKAPLGSFHLQLP